LKEERNYILQMIKKIRACGCNVLLIQKSILRDAVTDLSLHYLVPPPPLHPSFVTQRLSLHLLALKMACFRPFGSISTLQACPPLLGSCKPAAAPPVEPRFAKLAEQKTQVLEFLGLGFRNA
jgi:hypothetical protein